MLTMSHFRDVWGRVARGNGAKKSSRVELFPPHLHPRLHFFWNILTEGAAHMQERLTGWRHLDAIDSACCKAIIHAFGPDIFPQYNFASVKALNNDPDLPEDYRDLTSGFDVAMPTSQSSREVFPGRIPVTS
jgi:hypothetical protein